MALERRALGKGLRALIDTGGAGEVPETPDRILPIGRISPNPFQPRRVFRDDSLQELAESIRAHGILQPLIVRPHGDGFQLVSGERRWRAAQIAELEEVPVLVRDLADRDMLEVALVENLQREDIGPLEAARAYLRLMQEFGLTQEEVASRVGKSRSAVANTLRLLNLEGPIQNSLAEGQITEGHARALLAIQDPERRMEAWRAMLENGATVRDAEATARAERERSGLAPRRAPIERDPNLVAVETRLRERLGTKVAIQRDRSKGKGKLTIEFYSDEELERILEILGAIEGTA